MPLFDGRTLRQRVGAVGRQPDAYGVDSYSSQVIKVFPILFVVLSYQLLWIVRGLIRLVRE